MSVVPRRQFTPLECETWRLILQCHAAKRDEQICDLFLDGLQILGINESAIPNLDAVNATLESRSGYRGVFVEGLEEGRSFYSMLANRQFPIGNFIRDRADLNYTPAPDIVHDLYGHIPFYTDQTYGDFCQAFGEVAMEFGDRPDLLRQFERFFWFTAEFGLVKTPLGVKIFGAGIASSTGECEYALSGKPDVRAFDIDAIRKQEYRIDEMQPILFLLESPEQLYSSLGELRRRVSLDA